VHAGRIYAYLVDGAFGPASGRRFDPSKAPVTKEYAMKNLTAIAVLLFAISTAWGKDAASIYKSKCAACHGAQGEGKTGSKLAGTSLSGDDIVKVLTTGGLSKAPHIKPFKGANSENAKQVAAYVKTLK